MKKRKLSFVRILTKIFFGTILCVCIYAFLVFCVFEPKVSYTRKNTEFDLSRYYSFSGGNKNEGRRDFLYQFGVRCGEKPIKIKRVYIPKNFNDDFESLNMLQRRIGCDLKRYKGCFIRLYTYDATGFEGNVKANVFVHRDDIVGAYIQNNDTGKMFAVYEKY